MDEFAFFDQVSTRRFCARRYRFKGSALFIGTCGSNQFFDIYCGAISDDWPDYNGWTFTTRDNPLVDPEEMTRKEDAGLGV